jgi:hypothetical protein
MTTCCDCQVPKLDDQFPVIAGKPGYGKGKRDRCGECTNAQRRDWWAIRYQTPTGRAKWMLQNARNRAHQRGIEFTLTLEWAVERLSLGHCEATGLPFDFGTDLVDVRDGEWAHPLAPSIERKKPRGGYTPDNCEMIVWLLNRAKANFDRDIFDRVMQAYIARRPS